MRHKKALQVSSQTRQAPALSRDSNNLYPFCMPLSSVLKDAVVDCFSMLIADLTLNGLR